MLLALLVACGGDDDSPSDPTITPRDATPDSILTYPPGEIRSGNPSSISSGDFNGDGTTDLLVGAPFSTPDTGRNEAGRAYVLLGPISGDVDISADADLVILGAFADDNLGAAVAAGDLNADGVDDIVVGAPNSNALENLRTDMGEAYVVFGRSNLSGTIDTLAVEQDVTVQPAEGFSQLGRAFAIGDVNGDGDADLVAGAPFAGREPGTAPGSPRSTVGEVYVVYGGPNLGGLVTVMSNGEDVLLSGVRAYDQFGASVAVGDVDKDGTSDVIVGAPGYTGVEGSSSAAGGVFVFYGGDTLAPRITSDEADLSYLGKQDDSLGTLVAFSLGGPPRIVASAPTAVTPAGSGAGRVYVIDTESGGQGDLSDCRCAPSIVGSEPGSFFPTAMMVGAGGVLVLSSISTDESRSGRIYTLGVTIAGDIELTSVDLASTDGLTPGFGSAVAFADLDGDGSAGLLVQSTGGAVPTISVYDFEVVNPTVSP